MSQDKPNAERRAIVADRVFDGRGWHRAAAVMIQGGRIAGLASPRRGSIRVDTIARSRGRFRDAPAS